MKMLHPAFAGWYAELAPTRARVWTLSLYHAANGPQFVRPRQANQSLSQVVAATEALMSADAGYLSAQIHKGQRCDVANHYVTIVRENGELLLDATCVPGE